MPDNMGASAAQTGLAGAEAPEPHSGLGPSDGIPSAPGTPGPWFAFRERAPTNRGFCRIIGSRAKPNRQNLAHVMQLYCDTKGRESDANALLIAAAPQLYEGALDAVEGFKALRLGLLDNRHAVAMIDVHIEMLEVALAKASGTLLSEDAPQSAAEAVG
jgi:hypothetical protein